MAEALITRRYFCGILHERTRMLLLSITQEILLPRGLFQVVWKLRPETRLCFLTRICRTRRNSFKNSLKSGKKDTKLFMESGASVKDPFSSLWPQRYFIGPLGNSPMWISRLMPEIFL